VKSSQAILTDLISYIPTIIFTMFACASNQTIKLNRVAFITHKPSKNFE